MAAVVAAAAAVVVVVAVAVVVGVDKTWQGVEASGRQADRLRQCFAVGPVGSSEAGHGIEAGLLAEAYGGANWDVGFGQSAKVIEHAAVAAAAAAAVAAVVVAVVVAAVVAEYIAEDNQAVAAAGAVVAVVGAVVVVVEAEQMKEPKKFPKANKLIR